MTQVFRVDQLEVVKVINQRPEAASIVFQVREKKKAREQMFYALKVFHMEERPEELEELWHSRWYCESKAYERLNARGACATGLVPKIFATFSYFDPVVLPEVEAIFGGDAHHPCALLLEWLGSVDHITEGNYTRERWAKGLDSLRCINAADIVHRDLYVKNCVITSDSPERVMWIDYDVAHVFDRATWTEQDRKELEEEIPLVLDYGKCIEEWIAEGQPILW